MRLDNLIKIKTKSQKRLGRGIGSGRGKTAGRGEKGQKKKEHLAASFAGGTLPLYKKLPYKRGLGNPKRSPKKAIINLSTLAIFKPRSLVDITQLIEQKIITEKESRRGVKVLSGGEISKPLTVKLPVSKSAKRSIEKAGGRVENV